MVIEEFKTETGYIKYKALNCLDAMDALDDLGIQVSEMTSEKSILGSFKWKSFRKVIEMHKIEEVNLKIGDDVVKDWGSLVEHTSARGIMTHFGMHLISSLVGGTVKEAKEKKRSKG